MTPEQKKEMELSNRILELIEDKDNITTSDLQSAIEAIIREAINFNNLKQEGES